MRGLIRPSPPLQPPDQGRMIRARCGDGGRGEVGLESDVIPVWEAHIPAVGDGVQMERGRRHIAIHDLHGATRKEGRDRQGGGAADQQGTGERGITQAQNEQRGQDGRCRSRFTQQHHAAARIQRSRKIIRRLAGERVHHGRGGIRSPRRSQDFRQRDRERGRDGAAHQFRQRLGRQMPPRDTRTLPRVGHVNNAQPVHEGSEHARHQRDPLGHHDPAHPFGQCPRQQRRNDGSLPLVARVNGEGHGPPRHAQRLPRRRDA